MDNRNLYLKALDLIGKTQLEKKQRTFLLRIIKDAECKAQNLSVEAHKKKIALEILKDLNLTCKGHFRETDQNFRLIYARLADGFIFEEFQKVHRLKASQWLCSPQFSSYLRPSTLYSATHFESYLNEALKNDKSEISNRSWKDFKTLQELIDNRQGLDIPAKIRDLYAIYATARDRKDSEKMEYYNKIYQKKLEEM